MRELIEAASLVQAELSAHGWRFCFIGGIANLRWGTPRLTRDMDLTLLTGFGGEDPYIEALTRRFASRVPDGADFARRHRVLLLRTDDGTPIDIALGAMPFEERSVERASTFAYLAGMSLFTCSAEDLIVHKAFAARPQDWVDVEGVIVRQRGRLDWPDIWRELIPLTELKEAADIVDRLRGVANAAQDVIGPFAYEP